jgi:hypothetical protein
MSPPNSHPLLLLLYLYAAYKVFLLSLLLCLFNYIRFFYLSSPSFLLVFRNTSASYN